MDKISKRWFFRAVSGLGFCCLAVFSAAVPQENSEPAKQKNPVPATQESVAAGKKAYAGKCASCHGANGQGGAGNDLVPAAPSLVDGDWKHGGTDGELFNNIKNGIPPEFNMVPFKDQLKDDDIWNVVNFLRSIAKKK
jgi:mono/diheme cytochrome c family protein